MEGGGRTDGFIGQALSIRVSFGRRLFPHVHKAIDKLQPAYKFHVEDPLHRLCEDPRAHSFAVALPAPCMVSFVRLTEPGRLWVFSLYFRFSPDETEIVVFDCAQATVPLL